VQVNINIQKLIKPLIIIDFSLVYNNKLKMIMRASLAKARALSIHFKQNIHSITYYQICKVGGILLCAITYTLTFPFDIIKCIKHSYPNLYKSIGDWFKTIYRTDDRSRQQLICCPSSIDVCELKTLHWQHK
jgi:hypothetical protein